MTPGLCEAEEGRIDFERFALKIVESESLFLREDVRVRCGFFPDIASGTGGGAAGVDAVMCTSPPGHVDRDVEEMGRKEKKGSKIEFS
ncbi:hypothetical protein BHE74_00056733 [Ensete ventricosum]|nr:hypothetical protein GW17_00048843 [Ensete ventricosum]RWW38066.1 hypothetical protein BHE74_00056733 [Ensete ventricosum]RZS11169.1 hypothetical protein BHM03_00042482 [Ensete ventricosum]